MGAIDETREIRVVDLNIMRPGTTVRKQRRDDVMEMKKGSCFKMDSSLRSLLVLFGRVYCAPERSGGVPSALSDDHCFAIAPESPSYTAQPASPSRVLV